MIIENKGYLYLTIIISETHVVPSCSGVDLFSGLGVGQIQDWRGGGSDHGAKTYYNNNNNVFL